MSPLKKTLSPIASLRLTVALFVIAMVLIFFGTIEQKYQGNWAVVNQYFRSFVFMMPIYIAGLKVPFLGGYSLCILMLVNLLAAHLVRFKLTAKRAGIILLHAGLILLLIGELVTGMFAVEWQMRINEGETVNYAQDIRSVELAVVDPSPAEHDNTVVVSGRHLAKHASIAGDKPISSDLLPFDIHVFRWIPNAGLLRPKDIKPEAWASNPVDQGLGTMVMAVDLPQVTGVEAGQVDAPAAILKLTHNGETLGTWLTPLHGIGMGDPRQEVTVDGKTYLIELRFVRDYKPYNIHLIEFSHDKFVGTEIPRNFSSEVRLTDPRNNEDRTVLIYMNHPLRYQGETFYQSGYQGDTQTVLQVVRNPGWLMPYIACLLVSLGLTIHFGVMLGKFVGRARR